MNLDIIEKVVEYIEKNYHNDLSNETIERITKKSYGYARNEFRKIVNMPIDEYRIKRQLSLIVREIKNSNKNLSNSNLLPWNTQNSFYKAFKNNFGETPMQFIKHYGDERLQPKYDVGEFKNSYDNDIKIINGLIRKLGNKMNVLRYILSLKPYVINPIDSLFVESGVDIKYIIIRNKYAQDIKQKFFAGKVPKKFYNYHSKLLDKYYDVEKRVTLHQFDTEDIHLPIQYIFIKRSIIYRLMEEIELDSVINDKINPCNIVTLWYEETKAEEVEKGMIAIPNELINSKIGMMKWSILNKLLMQEQGAKEYKNMEQLRADIKYDYSKPINVFDEYCKGCNYKNNCNDDTDCLYIEELSEKQKEEFYDKPDHELLTMKRLCEEVKELFILGIIYFNCYEEEVK